MMNLSKILYGEENSKYNDNYTLVEMLKAGLKIVLIDKYSKEKPINLKWLSLNSKRMPESTIYELNINPESKKYKIQELNEKFIINKGGALLGITSTSLTESVEKSSAKLDMNIKTFLSYIDIIAVISPDYEGIILYPAYKGLPSIEATY